MPDDGPPLSDELAARLRRRWADAQRAARVPALSAAVDAGGAVLTAGAGEPPPGGDVQFRIGSVTKTFTAVLVLQLRDEGRLRLTDPLERHLPGTPLGRARVRDLLGHLAGVGREPAGTFWEAVPGGGPSALLEGLRDEDRVLPAGRAWHYSNLAYGLLGLVVAELRGAAYAEVLAERLLAPLGLGRTTWSPVAPHAVGFRVHPFADVLRPEPLPDTGAMGPAGQLWSTPADLVRWGAFLADPDPAVLAPDTLEEMCEPVGIRDPHAWTTGWGLGLQLFRRGEHVLVGHGGSMPGFTAGLAVARRAGVAAAVVANAWQRLDASSLAAEAVVEVLEHEPPAPRPWRAVPPDPALLELVGLWYYRGAPYLLDLDAGDLRLRRLGDADDTRAQRFAPDGPDRFRGGPGWDLGETLHVRRDETGQAVVLDVATWLFVREPDDPRGGP